MAARSSILVLLTLAPLVLGAAGEFPIPSECQVGLYLPPMPGTPQSDAQRIAMIPASTETFRLRYGISPGAMTTYVPSAAGTSLPADTRHEFQLTGLAPDTTHYWRVECLENGRWKRGWEGQFTTTPSAGGTVRLLVGTDAHIIDTWIGSGGVPPDEYTQRTLDAFDLMARHKGIHAYLDDGDAFHFHCRGSCDNPGAETDDFGRPFGANCIASGADTQAESIAFGEARASWVLRKMWRFLRFASSIWSRGNHDVGGAFGDNGAGAVMGSRHMQFRLETPWITTDTDVQFGAGHDLAADGTFSAAVHGMSDGDGPYRWAPRSPVSTAADSFPWLYNCGGSRTASDASNEWYVDLDGLGDPTNTFRLAYCPTCAGCTAVSSYGDSSVTWRLVRGSNMQYETKQVTAKYLPNQNAIYSHGWGDPEDGIMGPVPFSDHTVVINLDGYDHTPPAAYRPGFPCDNRSAICGWTLGANQYAGALALINDLGVAATGWENVETAIVLMHQPLGGHGGGPYPYARGGICEPATTCSDDAGGACEKPGECGTGGQCLPQNCALPFAHPEWEALHQALDAFQTRTDGVALVVLGHDHENAGGKIDGVYYYHAGQLGASLLSGWHDDPVHQARFDFNKDGTPAYYTNYESDGIGTPGTYGPAAPNDFPTEWGTEYRGYSLLTIEPAAESASGKTEVKLDYYINEAKYAPRKHGTKAYSFTLLGTQTQGEFAWHPVRLGGGGYVTGIDIHADGTRVVRTDAYGAYRWNSATSEWNQLVTTVSMPAADWQIETFLSGSKGVYEIKIAPTDSDTMYMIFDGKLFITTDAGVSWTKTNFTQQTDMDANDWTDLARVYAGKMAIDPNDADIVYVGTVSAQLKYTTDGGDTWNTAPTVPNGTAVPGISGICFADSNTIYAASKGNGVYRTTNGGSSWAEITTGGDPQNVTDGDCYQGSYWAVNGGMDAGNVWEWDGSTWTQRSSDNRGHAIDGDPNTADRLMLLNGYGGVQVSRDAGLNWDPIKYSQSTVAETIPWHAFGALPYMAAGDAMFDPAGATGQLYFAQGRGVWKSTLPTGALPSGIVWTENSVGIEELVVNEILAPPGESYVHVCHYDFGTLSLSDPDEYADAHGTVGDTNTDCQQIAWVATDDTNPLIVAMTQHPQTGENSGTTTDRGDNWSLITHLGDANRTIRYGGVAASTDTNFVGHLGSPAQSVFYTTDGGTNWNEITDFDGRITLDQGWYTQHVITADHVTANKFWLYHVDGVNCPSNGHDGVWRTTDGGANWTQVYANYISVDSGSATANCVTDCRNGRLRAVPGYENHLWWTPGGGDGGEPRTDLKLRRSTDGGVTWSTPNSAVNEVKDFGFGSVVGSYPRIWIAGWVSSVWGIWYSDDAAATWTKVGDYPLNSFDRITTIEGSKDGTNMVYVGFRGSGAAYYGP